MVSEDLVEIFKAIGLSEEKAKETAKNQHVAKNLKTAINEVRDLICHSLQFHSSSLGQQTLPYWRVKTCRKPAVQFSLEGERSSRPPHSIAGAVHLLWKSHLRAPIKW